MSYLAIKHLHITCVVLSGLGFGVRGFGMLLSAPWLKHRLVRTLPHLVDSVLLLSALTLAWQSGQYPFVAPWLTAKLAGLLAYIGLGSMALKRGATRAIRARYLMLAGLAYLYIVSVALTRNPLVLF